MQVAIIIVMAKLVTGVRHQGTSGKSRICGLCFPTELNESLSNSIMSGKTAFHSSNVPQIAIDITTTHTEHALLPHSVGRPKIRGDPRDDLWSEPRRAER
jgi:hypothetical protein